MMYDDYQGKKKMQQTHNEIVRLICEDDALLHEVVHVYVCALLGADTDPEITKVILT